jgi:zinc transport system substrate-binding protein
MWLDPHNAMAFAEEITETLVALDPANADLYKRNSAALNAKLKKLIGSLSKQLSPYKKAPYIVFHDAYQYFEKRFGLNGVGSVTVNPQRQPGAKHLHELQHKIKELGVACVFAEPQFKPKLVNIILEGTKANAGSLDPVGAKIPAGPALYEQLIQNNADAFVQCMSKK